MPDSDIYQAASRAIKRMPFEEQREVSRVTSEQLRDSGEYWINHGIQRLALASHMDRERIESFSPRECMIWINENACRS